MRLRLKESTEENIQHEKQNKELVSNISHDLKTPITAIKGYVEGIMDGVADTPEKMDKYIKTIYNKAIDMDRLINELTLIPELIITGSRTISTGSTWRIISVTVWKKSDWIWSSGVSS